MVRGNEVFVREAGSITKNVKFKRTPNLCIIKDKTAGKLREVALESRPV
jgi:hypothetical protein